jgi:hypothetical protein
MGVSEEDRCANWKKGVTQPCSSQATSSKDYITAKDAPCSK